jgi:hypothetical protein
MGPDVQKRSQTMLIKRGASVAQRQSDYKINENNKIPSSLPSPARPTFFKRIIFSWNSQQHYAGSLVGELCSQGIMVTM